MDLSGLRAWIDLSAQLAAMLQFSLAENARVEPTDVVQSAVVELILSKLPFELLQSFPSELVGILLFHSRHPLRLASLVCPPDWTGQCRLFLSQNTVTQTSVLHGPWIEPQTWIAENVPP
jgi:hypothetical protein